MILKRFQAKWKPVRVKKTRQIKNLEPRFDSIEAEKALGCGLLIQTPYSHPPLQEDDRSMDVPSRQLRSGN
jgi:hypothetical protein